MAEQLDDTLTDCAERLADVRARIAELKTVEADLEKKLTSNLDEGDYLAGDTPVKLSRGRRYDAELAEQVLTPEEKAGCWELKLSSALVRNKVAPARYEDCQKPNDKITVKVG